MRLLLATTNKDKLREFRQLFRGHKIILKHLPKEMSVKETGKTFRANAIIKAKAYGQKFNLPTLCDDTGLEIKVLNNAPGIYSNRFARGDFAKARKAILRKMSGQPDRRARFVCVLALWLPGGKVRTFTGTVDGRIAEKEMTPYGFGYDPIFIYPGPKMQVSHRALATGKLLAYLVKLV